MCSFKCTSGQSLNTQWLNKGNPGLPTKISAFLLDQHEDQYAALKTLAKKKIIFSFVIWGELLKTNIMPLP